jgi:Fe-S cluster assembly ATPase SufC
MLEINNLNVNVEDKKILHDINLKFETGKNYCILGHNGG